MGPYYDIVSLMLWRLPVPNEESPETVRKTKVGRRSQNLRHRLSGMRQSVLRGLAGML